MKAVLISIRPSWCGRIACGKKTIELRKTKPKQAAPFKCYIYCTSRINGPLSVFWNGNIIGNGKVIGEFICDRIECLDMDSVCTYCADTGYGEKAFYATSNGPVMCEGAYCDRAYQAYLDDEGFTLYRPPQSWCYVEEVCE